MPHRWKLCFHVLSVLGRFASNVATVRTKWVYDVKLSSLRGLAKARIGLTSAPTEDRFIGELHDLLADNRNLELD